MPKQTKSHMSVKLVKETMDTLDQLAKEGDSPKNGKEILEDTASLLLDLPAVIRILGFQLKCFIRSRYLRFRWRIKNFFNYKTD